MIQYLLLMNSQFHQLADAIIVSASTASDLEDLHEQFTVG